MEEQLHGAILFQDCKVCTVMEMTRQEAEQATACSAVSMVADKRDLMLFGTDRCCSGGAASTPQEAQQPHQDHDAEEEAQVIWRSIVVHLIHLHGRVEK